VTHLRHFGLSARCRCEPPDKSSSAPSTVICAFSGSVGSGDLMIFSTVPGNVVLGLSSAPRGSFRGQVGDHFRQADLSLPLWPTSPKPVSGQSINVDSSVATSAFVGTDQLSLPANSSLARHSASIPRRRSSWILLCVSLREAITDELTSPYGPKSLQLRVFLFSLFQDGDVRVPVRQQREKVLIRGRCFLDFARTGLSACEAKMS
jgi:hypothetical protein